MTTFETFWQQALTHHHTDDAIRERFPEVNTSEQLMQIPDDRYLSNIARRVFRAGMKHSVVDSKWDAFEEAFWGFNPQACQLIDDARFEELMQNSSLIRHWGKMKTIPVNAQMVVDVAAKHGGFGQFIADWPVDDIVNLWLYLKKNGAHLGGDGGARFLRMVGKDTFALSDDVVRVLVNEGIVAKKPTSVRDLNAVQQFFNELKTQTDLPYSAISVVLALSIGP